MTLAPGTTLGPYAVAAKIGEGGMGEVYRARDTKLDRDVALKVLPQAFTDDPDRLARFEREAKVLASLNHPNIGHIYGLEEAEGTKALVLELIEGPTLADRIKDGPIPVDEALPIAKQIAEALETAHEQGIMHRDLKPANIKLKPDGTVKVLDFGLAKALDTAPEGDSSQSPTITAAATAAGVILGTAAYMSPEQARGKPVDKRADIWAFGAVLYEMLTGKKPFVGDDASETLARVIDREPDWAAQPSSVPRGLSNFLRHCLQKNPKKRVRDIGDVGLALEGAFETTASMSAAVAPPAGRWQSLPLALVTFIVGAVVTAIAAWSLAWRAPSDSPVVRSSISFPAGISVADLFHYRIALSPGGTHLVYAGKDQLYLRAMDQLEATPIPGTEGALEPFFSPDGAWIAFWAAGQLKKVLVSGGVPVTLCETYDYFGATWSSDDTILFNGATAGILRVSSDGGTPEVVIPPAAQDLGLARPQLLPGGDWVLFSVYPTGEAAIQSLVTGAREVLIENGGGDVRYLPTGHLAYVLEGTLLAVPFDAERRIITGGPVPLVEGVRQPANGMASYALADDGTLVYERAGLQADQGRTLVWVDRLEGTTRRLAYRSCAST